MKQLEIRRAKVVEGGIDLPKGFQFYCDKNVGLLLSETFSTTVYQSAGNTLCGRSVAAAKNIGGKPTARAVLISNCGADVLQRGSRDRVTARVNYASDRLGVPASELRPLFVGEVIKTADDEGAMESIFHCAKEVLAGKRSDMAAFSLPTHTCAVQFFLGDDYPCVLSGAVFFDKGCSASKRTVLLTTDISIGDELLASALEAQVKETFGLIGVSSSPNDGFMMLASGLAGNNKILDRDVEFSKFSKVLEYVLFELCRVTVCGYDTKDSIDLQVVGARSKRLAWNVVQNACVYFQLVGNDNGSLLGGLISCIGSSGAFPKKKLQIWLQAEKTKVLLLDDGKILYLSEAYLQELFVSKNVSVIVDFHESNYGAGGWIKKGMQKVLF